jgi:YfiH family protein
VGFVGDEAHTLRSRTGGQVAVQGRAARGRVRWIVTTRSGGVSAPPYDSFNLGYHVGDEPEAVTANRERLATELGTHLGGEPAEVVWMEQVHGRTVTVVDGPRSEPVLATDALVTATPGLPVAALVADCVPVLLADSVAGVAGVVHAGRVGARVGVLPAALAAMRELGARMSDTKALLGPSICGSCYEVPEAMRADVARHLPGSGCHTRSGTPGLDLRAGLWHQLASEGLGKVGVDPRCTAEDASLFSHRGSGGRTGRLAAVVVVQP